MRENTVQNNSEYGHFSRSETYGSKSTEEKTQSSEIRVYVDIARLKQPASNIVVSI